MPRRTRTLTWTCRRCQHQWTELLKGETGSDNSHHFTLCTPCLDKLVVRRVCGVLRLVFRDEC